MDEITMRVARAVACVLRLRVLALLACEGEMAPSVVARELGVSLALVCTHLRRLSSAGLIRRRRSGVWCYCSAESPYPDDALSGAISRWLNSLLRGSPKGRAPNGAASARRARGSDPGAAPLRVIFEAATAFTSVRRLQILRRLGTGGPADAATLMQELHMSDAAVSRHTSKLIRRGYVSAARDGRRLVFRLARRAKSPVHARLLSIVRREWAKRGGHASHST